MTDRLTSANPSLIKLFNNPNLNLSIKSVDRGDLFHGTRSEYKV